MALTPPDRNQTLCVVSYINDSCRLQRLLNPNLIPFIDQNGFGLQVKHLTQRIICGLSNKFVRLESNRTKYPRTAVELNLYGY